MAFTTPTTDNDAADGLDYLHLNKIEENIRVLAGGDNTLPLSTDAATGKALAKRDADGDIAFRDVAARDIAASGGISASAMLCTAGEYVLDSADSLTNESGDSTRKIYCSRSGTIRIRFRLLAVSGTATGRIYKNGSAVGTLRSTTSVTYVEYSEDLAVATGDYFTVRGTGNFFIDRFRISVAEVL